jgi:hypothetical protein
MQRDRPRKPKSHFIRAHCLSQGSYGTGSRDVPQNLKADKRLLFQPAVSRSSKIDVAFDIALIHHKDAPGRIPYPYINVDLDPKSRLVTACRTLPPTDSFWPLEVTEDGRSQSKREPDEDSFRDWLFTGFPRSMVILDESRAEAGPFTPKTMTAVCGIAVAQSARNLQGHPDHLQNGGGSSVSTRTVPTKLRPSPVRNVVTGRRTGSMTGKFPSSKNSDLVPFESLLEADLIELMERDREVAAYFAQPETFRWREKSGRARSYTPDFLVVFSNGLRCFREVKPSDRYARDPTLRGRRSQIEHECAVRGAAFEVWTEKEIHRQS